MSELDFVARRLKEAKTPIDIFGSLHGDAASQHNQIKNTFKQIAKMVHPDRFMGDEIQYNIAVAAFQRLNELQSLALKQIAKGTYGKVNGGAPEVGEILIKGKYHRYGAVASGAVANLHKAYYEREGKRAEVVVKVARNARDNDLLDKERKNLLAFRGYLEKRTEGRLWIQCIPHVVDSFYIEQKGIKLRTNILERFEGFYNVNEIRKRIPSGIDGRTFVWMWKRLLLMLDWVHHGGLIHGAVLPPHVLFYPDNDGKGRDPRKHSVRLIDWCYSIQMTPSHHIYGTRLEAWERIYKAYYPPEVFNKALASTPKVDLYMAAKTMIYLLGGEPENNHIPKHIPDSLAMLLYPCLEKHPNKRPNDIVTYFGIVRAAAEKEYGEPKWHDFMLPEA